MDGYKNQTWYQAFVQVAEGHRVRVSLDALEPEVRGKLGVIYPDGPGVCCSFLFALERVLEEGRQDKRWGYVKKLAKARGWEITQDGDHEGTIRFELGDHEAWEACLKRIRPRWRRHISDQLREQKRAIIQAMNRGPGTRGIPEKN